MPHDNCETDNPAGWAMVGPCESPVSVAGLQAQNSDLVSVFGFGAGYFQAEFMDPGYGFWTNMAASGVLDLRGGALAKPVVARPI